MTILVNLIVCLIVGAAGAAAGWSLRGLLGGRASAPNINGDDNENSPEIRRRETEGIIARLQELAEGIAIDVGAHSESVLNVVLPPAFGELDDSQLDAVAGGRGTGPIGGCKGCTTGSLGKRIIYTFSTSTDQ